MRHSRHPGASLSAFFCPCAACAGCLVTGPLVVTSHRAPSSQSGSGHRTDNTHIRTHRGHIMRIGLLVIVTCHQLVTAQGPVKLGDVIHDLIFPSEQLMGTSPSPSITNIQSALYFLPNKFWIRFRKCYLF